MKLLVVVLVAALTFAPTWRCTPAPQQPTGCHTWQVPGEGPVYGTAHLCDDWGGYRVRAIQTCAGVKQYGAWRSEPGARSNSATVAGYCTTKPTNPGTELVPL